MNFCFLNVKLVKYSYNKVKPLNVIFLGLSINEWCLQDDVL